MSTVLRELFRDPESIYRFDTDTYHALLTEGRIEEAAPLELLDGVIVKKERGARRQPEMRVGHLHAWVVKRLAELDAVVRASGLSVQTQQPITLPPHDEPEPDAAIVRGSPDDYLTRHPGPADVLCVFEVADASLHRDRSAKLAIYARAGIPAYVLINLVESVIEVYTHPLPAAERYAHAITLQRHESLNVSFGAATLQRPVADFLPPL